MIKIRLDNIITLLFLGYMGVRCDEICPKGTYGDNCSFKCNCRNNTMCAPETGICSCEAGWKGQQCNIPCEETYFGVNCENKCPCGENEDCNLIDGK